ncbi:MAG: efflux RND transporter periplasmic adaptor subunit [Flavobacteriales bacterium]|nr:efflux RND transporter periplasmic adaptor subunit [Flavobacteriales bacterium]
MKKAVFVILTTAVLALLAWTMFYLYEKSQQKPITYRVASAEVTNIIKKTVATGSVLPRKEIQIKPVVSGIIDKLYIEPGMAIKEGDIMARIKVIPDMVTLNNAENRVEIADLNLINAQIDFDRNQKLFDDGVISYADFQPFDLAKKNAQTEFNAAKDNLQIVKEGVSSKNSAAANTLVRSTITGMILDVPVEIGNSVIELNNFNEGTTIASVANMSDLIFKGKVDESEVGKISEGMDLILTIGAIENEEFTAKLEYIAPKGVEENGAIQFEIKAAVDLKENQFIRAGYSANANVVLDRRDNVLAIDEGLVQYESDTVTFVEISVGDQKFERRNVKLGLSDGIKVEVLSGISEESEIKVWNQPIVE